jgi:hypothetical protein
MKCLLILPLDASAKRVRDATSRVLRENQVEPVGLDDAITVGARWVDEIYGLLRSCDFVIADITRQNPSVLFELGVAHGLGKPFILLINEAADSSGIPSFLSGYQFLTYDAANLSGLVSRLGRVVQSLSKTG